MSANLNGLALALEVGEATARDIVTICNNSDMGEIREDATAEAIAKMIVQVPREWHTVALTSTTKLIAMALSDFSDVIQGRA